VKISEISHFSYQHLKTNGEKIFDNKIKIFDAKILQSYETPSFAVEY
jgi:hypothetical protein